MTKNMTRGNPLKLIVLFSIPMLIGNIFQQFYNMADAFIVGRTLGVNALAAVGSTGSLMFLIIGFAFGATTGMAIITAQRYGAGDTAGVRRSLAASIMLSLGISALLSLVSLPFTRQLLELMRTPAEILDDAYIYLSISLLCIFAPMLYNVFSNFLRAVGNSKTPLYFLVVACVTNIVLDYVFILYFGMGVAGVVIATILAQLLAAGLCARTVFHTGEFRLTVQDFKDAIPDISAHLRLGLPMGFQSSIIAIGGVVLQFALNGLGATAVAAFTAAGKIDGFATLPLQTFGVTMATYVAQNYGAGAIDRIRKGVRQCATVSVICAIVMGAVNVFAGARLAQLFLGVEGEIVSMAHQYLIINGVSYTLLGLLFVYRYTLQGLGKAAVPTVAGVMELIMRSAAGIFFASSLGFAGACMASPLAWLGAAVPLTIAYFVTMRRLERGAAPAPAAPMPCEAVQG